MSDRKREDLRWVDRTEDMAGVHVTVHEVSDAEFDAIAQAEGYVRALDFVSLVDPEYHEGGERR